MDAVSSIILVIPSMLSVYSPASPNLPLDEQCGRSLASLLNKWDYRIVWIPR